MCLKSVNNVIGRRHLANEDRYTFHINSLVEILKEPEFSSDKLTSKSVQRIRINNTEAGVESS